MFKRRPSLFASVTSVSIALFFSGTVWAQAPQAAPESVRSQDVFAEWHTNLSAAADRTLAAALADRPWMKSSRAGENDAGPIPKTPPDAVTRVRAAIQRVQQLRPTIEPILRQEGVPAELSAIVLVESGGQLMALSPKGARGAWQFMPDTARRYGLAVTAQRDERVELAKSTRAAARYLRDLYQQFGDWQLAFAAYNAGEQAVAQAVARMGSRDFSAIRRALPQETRNYVPAVLEAMGMVSGGPQRLLRTVGSSTRRVGASYTPRRSRAMLQQSRFTLIEFCVDERLLKPI